MLMFCLMVVWLKSCSLAGTIMAERRISPNPISLFVVLVPIVNTCYVLFRIKSLFRILFQGCDMGWFKDTLKKL
jgi:hypothetical protein